MYSPHKSQKSFILSLQLNAKPEEVNDLYKIYEKNIKQKLKTLGKGNFENYLDDTYRGHEVSKHGLKIISDSIESN